MPNPYFKFKQFTVFHHKCAMKVGADGVTLGAWADVSGAKSILDAGCGSGLITLMLAQRSEAKITAIDIDEQSIVQTKENVGNSLWDNRIRIIHTSLQQFAESSFRKFDLIVCNPPFFVNSLKSPSDSRTRARHTDSLSHLELILAVEKLLAEKQCFFCSRKVTLFPNTEKPAKRLLLEFRTEMTDCKEDKLTVEKERNVYTSEYSALVKDFYLDKNTRGK